MRSLPPTQLRDITVDEVKQHNKKDDIWIVIRGKVYNVTQYLTYHPGGSDILLQYAGCDGTELYDQIHSFVNIDVLLGNCSVGILQP